MVLKFRQLLCGNVRCQAFRVKARRPKRFIGVDIAYSRYKRLIEQRRFQHTRSAVGQRNKIFGRNLQRLRAEVFESFLLPQFSVRIQT